MLQMFAIYFAPYYVFGIRLTPDSKWYACIVAFIINYAAYFAEISVRAFSPFCASTKRLKFCYTKGADVFSASWLPQVVAAHPAGYGNEVITLVKDTSLAFAIGVRDVLTAKALVASQVSMVPFAISAAFYWGFNFWSRSLWARWRKADVITTTDRATMTDSIAVRLLSSRWSTSKSLARPAFCAISRFPYVLVRPWPLSGLRWRQIDAVALCHHARDHRCGVAALW